MSSQVMTVGTLWLILKIHSPTLLAADDASCYLLTALRTYWCFITNRLFALCTFDYFHIIVFNYFVELLFVFTYIHTANDV